MGYWDPYDRMMEAERRERDRRFVRAISDGQLRDLHSDQSARPDPEHGEAWLRMMRTEMGRRGVRCEQ
jgi:predicted SnoaL-like aldol condensation-catalyzing enzyme